MSQVFSRVKLSPYTLDNKYIEIIQLQGGFLFLFKKNIALTSPFLIKPLNFQQDPPVLLVLLPPD